MSISTQIHAASTAIEKAGGRVVVVPRNDQKVRVGQGMAAGMLTVIKHFGKAFDKRLEDKSEITGMFTVEYPEERMELPEAYRNMPILLYDDATGHELCTSCFQCERICPPKVIHITQAKHPETGKPVPAAEEFVIEYDSCMSCGYCHEICPFDAIKMDHAFELSTADHLSMDVHKADLDRPISYYKLIAPNLWSEVEANAMKKLQNNIKRRPGTIGVAPDMVGKPRAATPGAAAPTAKAAAAPVAAAPAAAPAAAVGKNMSPEKLAKLEAIRAAKRAQRGEVVGSVAGAVPIDPQGQTASVEMGTHTEESAAGMQPNAAVADTSAASGPVAAVGQNMSDEKKARLEAIRAAKRAQHEQGG
jgi:formate hydrogenlyase subunit 6/NADH:ubiquinone oxidoreductase subunit I